MIALNQSTKADRHIQRIEELLQQGDRSIDTIVFADSHPEMVRRLAAAMNDDQALILPVPQALWSSETLGIEDAAVWSIEQAGVKTLMLAGTSLSAVPYSRPVLAASTSDGQGKDFLQRVRDAQVKKLQAEQQFASEVDALLKVPEINDRLVSGELHFQGLFYRGESGVFTAYEPAAKSFQALEC